MLRNTVRLLLLYAAVSRALGAATAEAGLVSPDFMAESEADAPAPPHEDAPRGPRESRDQRLVAGTAHTSQQTTTGAGSASSPGRGATPCAISETVDSAPNELVAYVSNESRLGLPVPFLDGIFRPPRRRA